MNEKYHKEIYNKQLHREHVHPLGANDLSNCIPACTSCNSTKSNQEFEDWYNKDNDRFTDERLHKINQWLENDYKIHKHK